MELITDACTDTANAEFLVEHYADRFRFVTTRKKLLAWDGTRWRADESAVVRLAIEAAQARLGIALDEYRSAAEQLAEAQSSDKEVETAKKRLKRAGGFIEWGARSQQRPRIEAAVALAKHARNVAVSHLELDANPLALNVANGTIDLSTGKLRAHNPRDLITKIAPVAYDANAKAPTWDAFLSTVLDADVIAFLRRFIGYSLTGDVREHCFVFNHGKGANGKSTATRAWSDMLGDYAAPAPRSLLFRSKSERHPTELATLCGLRFALCSEIDDGQSFDEAKLKDLTGGDLISARGMGEDFWSFAPTHKLMINGNHKPRVSGTDDGVWRRIFFVPWLVTIPAEKRDHQLSEKLRAEFPGILAWAVRGCLEWQENGLQPPAAVLAATQAYRDESDPLAEFFELRCVFDVEGRVPRRMLRKSYEEHCEENGLRPIDARSFATRLRERGVADRDVRHEGKTTNGWSGVRLRDMEREAVGTVGTVGSKLRSDGDFGFYAGESAEDRYRQVPTLPTRGAA